MTEDIRGPNNLTWRQWSYFLAPARSERHRQTQKRRQNLTPIHKFFATKRHKKHKMIFQKPAELSKPDCAFSMCLLCLFVAESNLCLFVAHSNFRHSPS